MPTNPEHRITQLFVDMNGLELSVQSVPKSNLLARVIALLLQWLQRVANVLLVALVRLIVVSSRSCPPLVAMPWPLNMVASLRALLSVHRVLSKLIPR